MNGQPFDNVDYSAQGFIYSDDLMYEVRFGTLYKWYKKAGRDKQKYKLQMQKDMYTEQEKRVFIYPYLDILARNQKEMRARCMELVEAHQDYIPIEDSVYRDRELADMGVEEKINALYELWDAGTNKDNAERDAYSGSLDKDMHGRIMSEYQTYDYLDNDKYKRIEQLLDIMQETFGFGKEEEQDEELDTDNEGVEMVDLPARSQAN